MMPQGHLRSDTNSSGMSPRQEKLHYVQTSVEIVDSVF